MEPILLGILIILVVVLITIVLLRRPHGATDLSTPLQNLTQALNDLRVDMRGMAERVSSIEQSQYLANQSLGLVKTNLTEISTHTRARQEMEQRTADSIRRLEAVIAGTQSKGAAGENLLDAVFSQLPPEWQVRGYQVGNKVAEFGLRLPNNLVLPIDSKWPGTNLIEQFYDCDDPVDQQRLKAQIESIVLAKAKEVQKYLDPNVTATFGIAAVPDAVYDLCCGIQTEAFRMNVVLISYSLFVPYLLLVFQTILKTSQNIDLHKLDAYLQSAQTSIAALQEEIEGRFAKSLTMLANSRSDMSAHLSKLSGGLTSLQIGAGSALSDVQTPDVPS